MRICTKEKYEAQDLRDTIPRQEFLSSSILNDLENKNNTGDQTPQEPDLVHK